MEYKGVSRWHLVPGNRYYIVSYDVLRKHNLNVVAFGRPGYSYDGDDVLKSIPAGLKSNIFNLSGERGVGLNVRSGPVPFVNFLDKNGNHTKDSRKQYGIYLFFDYEPTPIDKYNSTVSAENIHTIFGESISNNSEISSIEPESIQPPMTQSEMKATADLIRFLTWGEDLAKRGTLSDILARKPRLEYLVKRYLSELYAYNILPEGHRYLPVSRDYDPEAIPIFSMYGAIELLIETVPYVIFDQGQKIEYIKAFINAGADPSKALTTAILSDNVEIVNLLLDLGANPNHITKYYDVKNNNQQFLVLPILATTPIVMPWHEAHPLIDTDSAEGVPPQTDDIFADKKDIIISLLERRVFIEQDGNLVRIYDSSSAHVPAETPIYVTRSKISQKLIDRFKDRLVNHKKAMASRQLLSPFYAAQKGLSDITIYNQYNAYLEWVIEYLEKELSIRMAEPGGPIYTEARRHFFGNAINAPLNNISRSPTNELRRMELLATSGGRRHSRKHRSKKRRYTRRR